MVLVLPEPPAAVRELGALALCEAAEVPDDDRMRAALVLDIADVELVVESALLVLDRFSTPPEVADRDEPLLLEAGLRRALLEAAAPPAPAPEDEPAVLDATTVDVPLWDAWI